MSSLSHWKSLHDEIHNSSDVKYHHNRSTAAAVLGHPDEAQKHHEAWKAAVKNHPKYPEYHELSKKLGK